MLQFTPAAVLLTACFSLPGSLTTLVAVTAAEPPPKTVDVKSIRHKVSVSLGEKCAVTFAREGDRLVNPVKAEADDADQPNVTIQLKTTSASPFPPPRPDASRPYLEVENHFDRALQFRILIRRKGSDEFFEFAKDNDPTPADEGFLHCWDFDTLVEEVVLCDFRLTNSPAE